MEKEKHGDIFREIQKNNLKLNCASLPKWEFYISTRHPNISACFHPPAGEEWESLGSWLPSLLKQKGSTVHDRLD